jgi:hypothetical protein
MSLFGMPEWVPPQRRLLVCHKSPNQENTLIYTSKRRWGGTHSGMPNNDIRIALIQLILNDAKDGEAYRKHFGVIPTLDHIPIRHIRNGVGP